MIWCCSATTWEYNHLGINASKLVGASTSPGREMAQDLNKGCFVLGEVRLSPEKNVVSCCWKKSVFHISVSILEPNCFAGKWQLTLRIQWMGNSALCLLLRIYLHFKLQFMAYYVLISTTVKDRHARSRALHGCCLTAVHTIPDSWPCRWRYGGQWRTSLCGHARGN